MTWTNLSFPFGSLLSSTQMTQLDANLDAVAAGDSGAPAIRYGYYLFEPDYSASRDSTFITVRDACIFIPTAANTLNVSMYVRCAVSTRTANIRLNIGSTNSDVALGTTTTSAWEVSSLAMNVSSITGWQVLNLQMASTGGGTNAVYSHGMFGYFT